MTPARLLERVAALVARASSSFEEEARTSAVIACRLIREHALEVRYPGRCLWCGFDVPTGSVAAFYPEERQTAHEDCHEEACCT